MHFDDPRDALRYHVTGAIERGEKEPIVAMELYGIMDIDTQNYLAGEIADAQVLIDVGDTNRAQAILDSVREQLTHT